jgi:hypothetical protein
VGQQLVQIGALLGAQLRPILQQCPSRSLDAGVDLLIDAPGRITAIEAWAIT